MDSQSPRTLLFPRVDEARINQQKLERTCEIKEQIMADLKRNNTASLYHIQRSKNSEAGASLPRRKAKGNMANPENYRLLTENQQTHC